jgi:nitrite reductase/ring-hydroxylating ferredoxin subunit
VRGTDRLACPSGRRAWDAREPDVGSACDCLDSLEETDVEDSKVSTEGCDGCPVLERRTFLREAAMMAAGALAAIGLSAQVAEALPVRFARALGSRGQERAYAIPASDGVEIDKEESVIVARMSGMLFAFSLACPHQNTALRWLEADKRFQCPKHKSKYRPDGTFIEGRATRGMDRFAVRREGDRLVVDLDKLYREDADAAEWKVAFVKLEV